MSLIERLGLQHPIIQAPMAGSTTPELAAAVSNAGALGSLGLGAASVDAAREAIQQTRRLTSKPFNVNFFCHAPARVDAQINAAWLAHLAPHFERAGARPPAELAEIYTPIDANSSMQDMILAEKPPVVSFHFGVPGEKLIQAIQGYGGLVLMCVTTLAEAAQAEAAGADALIAQGMEAGGHRGTFDANHDEEIALAPLLRDLVSACRVPVIAAGGLMDGRDIDAVRRLGAAAAQLGTAFVACPESAAAPAYRDALAAGGATAITRLISGRAARGLVGPFQTGIAVDAPQSPDYPVCYDAAKQLNAAAKAAGDTRYAPNWAGQGVARIRMLPAAELVARLVEEYEAQPD